MRVCAEPGCPTLTDATRCETHRRERRRASDGKRPGAAARGYDAKWRKTRAAYLRAHPICQHPDGCIAPATDVHHLDGRGPLGEHGHDEANLLGLCHAHHSRVTSHEQRGGWNA